MTPDEIALIRDAAQRLLNDHATRETIAAAETGGWPGELWSSLADAGLTMALVSEGGGGVGLDIADALDLAGLVAEYAAPVPFGETMLAAWLLDRAGIAVPDGALTFAGIDADRKLARIPWGRSAQLVLVTEHNGQAVLALLEPGELNWEHATNMAGEPRDTATLDPAFDTARFVPSPISPTELRQLGAALRSAQIAGALRRSSDLAVLYATQRSQFGKTLSQFQAIQQSLAVLATQAAVATAAAGYAARAIAAGSPMPAIAIAKARCGEAAGAGSAIAHQIHGAIGFTLEHDLQFSTRRLLSWRDEFGGDAEWNEAFGRLVLAGGDVWKAVSGR
ncbi:acyl-CoA dehydrogenase [Sphingomonas sp. AOB5]|uniref:acyl-CoA dehydrogenase n=1 Tax=Sphingomonas sp. AOB5 TaxID=3034017 RepID=UPI0023F9036E|nr:acyl-CoA dehydrogenase [Sphingomonas sp. AOB5]MDF7774832.1 acyl-CoA dehydrogenase [Sphingomonas sp. AOB5]